MASSGASGQLALDKGRKESNVDGSFATQEALTSPGKKRRGDDGDDSDDSPNDGRDSDHHKSAVAMPREIGHSVAVSPTSSTPGQPSGKRAKQAHDPNRSNFDGFGDYIAHKNASVRQRQAATAPLLESNIFAGVVVSCHVYV